MAAQPSTDFVWTQLNASLREFVRRRVSDDHVADDLLQETFLRIHRGIAALQDSDRLAAWVYQITRNVINDYYRGPKAMVALADDIPCDDESAKQLRCRSGPWLEELIQQLPDRYQKAVLLSELEGLPQKEIANRLHLSLSGAKSRVQRGRAMLKKALDQCCEFHFDRRGNLIDVEPRPDRPGCKKCDDVAVDSLGCGP